MLKSTYSLPGLILGFFIMAVVMIQSSNAEGLSAKDIGVITQKITVRIDGRDDQHSGSGIIVQENGNDYLVLTNWHVVNTDGNYTIYTYDGQQYTVDSSDIQHLSELDLAVLRFNSGTNYQTASIGDASQLEPGTKLWIGGFPLPGPVIKQRTYLFLPGDISGRLTKPENGGYELICNASAIQGMSGGPILNESGQVVGVNGLGVKNPIGGTILNLVYGIPINTYEVLAQQNPPQTARDLDNLGWDKYNEGDFQGAFTTFTKVIDADPNYADAYIGRGLTRNSTGDYEGAIADYNKAIEINPNDAFAYNNRGLTRNSTGDYEGAIADYNKAIEINPNYGLAYNNRASLRLQLGDEQGSQQDLDKAKEIGN